MCHFLSLVSTADRANMGAVKKGKFLCQKASKVRHNCPWEYNSLIFMWLSTALRWIAVGTNGEIYSRSRAALPAIFLVLSLSPLAPLLGIEIPIIHSLLCMINSFIYIRSRAVGQLTHNTACLPWFKTKM